MFLGVLWNLCALQPDSSLTSFKCLKQCTKQDWGPLKGAVSAQKALWTSETVTNWVGERNEREPFPDRGSILICPTGISLLWKKLKTNELSFVAKPDICDNKRCWVQAEFASALEENFTFFSMGSLETLMQIKDYYKDDVFLSLLSLATSLIIQSIESWMHFLLFIFWVASHFSKFACLLWEQENVNSHPTKIWNLTTLHF